MRVAMTGSTGLIGTALSGRLTAAGHEVRPLRHGRPGEEGVDFDAGSGWIREGALEDTDAVVNLAGVSLASGRWTEGRKRALRESRIVTTRLLVDQIGSLEARPRVLVSASGVDYYGDRGDEVLTEDSSKGEGFLSDLVADWEREAMRAAEYGVRVVCTRAALVMARHGGALPQIRRPFAFGVGGKLGSGRQWWPWIDLDDEVRVIERALTDESLSGPVNAAGPQQVTNAEFTKVLGRVMGRPTLFTVPAFALRLVFGREMADQIFLGSKRVEPARLRAAGFDFEHEMLEDSLRRQAG